MLIIIANLLLLFNCFIIFSGLGKPSNVQKLNEAAAIELGAELLGETIIFLVAAFTLSAEYYRQSKKSATETALLEEKWNRTENRIQELEFITEKQRTEIRELTRLVYAKQSNFSTQPSKSIPNEASPKSAQSKQPLNDAINESVEKIHLTR